jgi:arylsulfatase A-like enzyme
MNARNTLIKMMRKILSFLLLVATFSVRAANKPNIVFILTDDMGYSDLNCYGGHIAPTPNLDKFAQEGVRFTHFYDDAPICSASRCAFMTGMYPARWNFTTYLDNKAHNRSCEQINFLPTNAPALGRMMQAAGYVTAHFGKWHLGGGRDVTNAPLFSAYGYDEHSGTYESPEPDPLITAKDWIWSPVDFVKRWDRTRYFVDHALDFLRRHKDQPCYVEIWPDDTHTPWVPNAELEKKRGTWNSKANFAAVLAEYDKQMGRFFDGLKALGMESNTIVVFTSDNGPLPSFNHERTGGLRGSKLSLYEGGVRVPFIVRWPGHTTAGRVDQNTVLEAVDLFPTFSAIAGSPMPTDVTFNGQNMSAAWFNKSIVQDRTIFWEYGRPPSKDFYYPRAAYDRSPHLAVREGKWKLLVNADGSSAALYDMTKDADETADLSSQEPEVAQRLKAAALAWKRSLPKYPDVSTSASAAAQFHAETPDSQN